jgi:SHS2 domain-containing protein
MGSAARAAIAPWPRPSFRWSVSRKNSARSAKKQSATQSFLSSSSGRERPTATEKESSYREIEHTADIGIEVEADSAAKLFAAAAEAFYGLLADPSGIQPKKEILVSAGGDGWENLLQAWLSELLAEFNLAGFVGKSCEITRIEAVRVDGKVKGEKLDLRRHRFHTEIKGVTYHGLKVWQDGDKWRARVIFDV